MKKRVAFVSIVLLLIMILAACSRPMLAGQQSPEETPARDAFDGNSLLFLVEVFDGYMHGRLIGEINDSIIQAFDFDAVLIDGKPLGGLERYALPYDENGSPAYETDLAGNNHIYLYTQDHFHKVFRARTRVITGTAAAQIDPVRLYTRVK